MLFKARNIERLLALSDEHAIPFSKFLGITAEEYLEEMGFKGAINLSVVLKSFDFDLSDFLFANRLCCSNLQLCVLERAICFAFWDSICKVVR